MPPELIDLTLNYLTPKDMAVLRSCSTASYHLVHDHAPRQTSLAKLGCYAPIQDLEEDMERLHHPDSSPHHYSLLHCLRSWVGYLGIDGLTHIHFADFYEYQNSERFVKKHPSSDTDHDLPPYHQRLSSLVFYLLWADQRWNSKEATEQLEREVHARQNLWAPSAAYPVEFWEASGQEWRDDSRASARMYQESQQSQSPNMNTLPLHLRNIYYEWDFQNRDEKGNLFGIALGEWQGMRNELKDYPLFGATLSAKLDALEQLGLGYWKHGLWYTRQFLERTLELREIAGGLWQYYPKYLDTMDLVGRWLADGGRDEVVKGQILDELSVVYIGGVN